MKPKRYLKGIKNICIQFTACPYINEAKEICSSTWKWNITKDVDRATLNCVNMIECKKKHIAYKNILERQ